MVRVRLGLGLARVRVRLALGLARVRVLWAGLSRDLRLGLVSTIINPEIPMF